RTPTLPLCATSSLKKKSKSSVDLDLSRLLGTLHVGASRSPLPGCPALAFPCRGTIYRALSVAPSPPLSSRPMECGGLTPLCHSHVGRASRSPLLGSAALAFPCRGTIHRARFLCAI